MAGDKVNTYAQDDSDILALQLTTDKTFKGYHQLTLTEYGTTTVPAIAAGSAIECNGALYKFDTEEAISTTDPVTSSTVADGAVYVCIVPDTTTATAAFTATAPTWSDSKQGWYGTGGRANYRYVNFRMDKSGAYYYDKRFYDLYKKIRTIDLLYPSLGAFTSRTSAADNNWYSVCYGNGIFVAVSSSGTGNRVMTSPDGIEWKSRTPAADNDWRGVTYGNGIFVAVAITGTGNRVMTSTDGIEWKSRESAADNNWHSVCYGNGLFVAVAATGTGNRVMTSPDGIEWKSRTSAADNNWFGITYGNSLFVAVAVSGTGNRVMTSPDGITWTSRTSAADNEWRSVCYGNGLFVAVSESGTGKRVMTSPDGITWTSRTSAADNGWRSVCYGNGLFVAVAITGTGNRVMTSTLSWI